MQQIATLKSILYGMIITFIFMVSSCEFQFTPSIALETSTQELVASNL